MRKYKHKDKKDNESCESQEQSQDTKQQQETLSEVEKLRQDYKALEDKFRRLSADYANYQKRVPRQIEESVAYKVESFIKSLLPGIDNFDHAILHAEKGEIEDIIKGLKMVYDSFLKILAAHGLEQLDASGSKFDPNCHQAVMQQCEENKEDGVILEQYQKGYKLNGRLLRPAMVVVNKLEQPDEQAQEQQPGEQQKSSDENSENEQKKEQ